MTTLLLALHEGHPIAPHELWSAWSGEPGVLLGLGLTAALYAAGSARLPRRSGRRRVRSLEATAFWSGWLLVALALVSPLHRMGEALLSAHMVQHEVLMVAAAPLLVLGRPFTVMLWAFPLGWRRRLGRWGGRLRPAWALVTGVGTAWALHALVLLGWHVPALYQRTLDSAVIHSLQHTSFLLSALWFWWSVLPGRHLAGREGGAVLSLFSTMVYTGGLGALLAVSPRVWYPAYGNAALAWGLTPLEDQQLAGLVMWVPAGVSYLLATLWLVAAWLRQSEARVRRRERVRAGVAALLLVGLAAAGCGDRAALSAADAARLTGGDPARGRAAIRRHGCGSCHTIGGIPGADALVGPELNGVVARVYIAGVLTNSPANLVRWIQDPQAVDSLTAMPTLGVSRGEARDIAAYLYTLRAR